MIWPIYIPTKGRPETQKTFAILRCAELKPILVVEPQEAEKYRYIQANADFLVLPENDQGIAYVRNFILENALKNAQKWYWMLDDDITGLYLTQARKTVKTAARDVLLAAQSLFVEVPQLAQGALEYQQFAWSQTKPIKLNSYCDVAVCVNTSRIGAIRYRPEMNLKEDRDFTLQILSSGLRTARSSLCSFSAPKNGSNAGGLKPVYSIEGREAQASQKMASAWPGICEPHTKPDGRQDVKINWKVFQNRL